MVRVVAADLFESSPGPTAARRRSARQLIEQVGGLVEQVAGPIGSATRYLAVVGTPGALRPGDSHLALAPHLPGWERPEVLSSLRELVACPVVFQNDVNLAAIGELSRGGGQGVDDFVLVSIGTGLGMGVVLDGRLHRGASGLAGEVGYLPTAGAEHIEAAIGPLRGQGAMERLVSSQAVVHLAKEAGLSPAGSAAAVIDATHTGDPVALQVVDMIAARLAFCIASVAAVLDPELVILGGGIGTGAGPLLLEPLRRNLAAISPLRPRLATSELGSAAVVVGAVTEGLRLVVERLFDVDAPPTPALVGTGEHHREGRGRRRRQHLHPRTGRWHRQAAQRPRDRPTRAVRPRRGQARTGRRRQSTNRQSTGMGGRTHRHIGSSRSDRRRRLRAPATAHRWPGGRHLDETIPLGCGCVGQETTGAGGFAKALRTVPVVLDIADEVRRRAADDAWIIDFTNPVGIVTSSPRPRSSRSRALQRGHRVPAVVRQLARGRRQKRCTSATPASTTSRGSGPCT